MMIILRVFNKLHVNASITKLVIIVFLFFSSFLSAQASHVFVAGISYLTPVLKDELLSLVGNYSQTASLNLGYHYARRNQLHIVRLLVGGGRFISIIHDSNLKNFSDYSSVRKKGYNISISLDARSLFPIYSNTFMIARLGIDILGNLDMFLPSYLNISWVGEAAAGITGDVEFSFGYFHEQHINLFISVFFVSLLSRPDWPVYRGKDEIRLRDQGIFYILGRTRLASFNTYVRNDVGIMYRYQVNRTMTVAFRYDFFYRNITFSRKSVTFSHSLSVNVLWSFPARHG